ncbi:ankyrin [Wilcoxina mikolae CBS 423.85]|nr:ankyrin [Wilcoxina mikolae CBS 423.85]
MGNNIYSSSQARLEQKLDAFIREFQTGLREGSVISSLNGDASTDDAETWRQLQIELEDIGIPASVIRDKKQFIIAWFQQALRDGDFEESSSQMFTYPTDESDHKRPSESSIQPKKATPSIDLTFSTPLEATALAAPEVSPFDPTPRALDADPKNDNSLPSSGARKKRTFWRARLVYELLHPRTGLIKAVKSGVLEDVQKLVERGCNLNVRKDGWTPLSIETKQRNIDIVRCLLEHGASTVQGAVLNEALHHAVKQGDHEITCTLLEYHADPSDVRNLKVGAIDPKDITPLFLATKMETLQKNYVALAKLLLVRGAYVDSRSPADNWTPLHVACRYSSKEELVALLLDRGAHINAKTKYFGSTALHMEAAYGGTSGSIVRLLLDRGADVEERRTFLNQDKEDAQGCNALYLACKFADLKDTTMVCTILDHGANVNAVSTNGWTTLHAACLFTDNEALVKLLLDRGAQLSMRTVLGGGYLGKLALHYVVRRSIENHNSPTAIREDGPEALNTAIHNEAIVKLLLDRGAGSSFNKDDWKQVLY